MLESDDGEISFGAQAFHLSGHIVPIAAIIAAFFIASISVDRRLGIASQERDFCSVYLQLNRLFGFFNVQSAAVILPAFLLV